MNEWISAPPEVLEKYWYLEEELNLTPLLKRHQSLRGNVTEVGPGLCVHRGRDGEVVVVPSLSAPNWGHEDSQ